VSNFAVSFYKLKKNFSVFKLDYCNSERDRERTKQTNKQPKERETKIWKERRKKKSTCPGREPTGSCITKFYRKFEKKYSVMAQMTLFDVYFRL
jgi:hypothetical protein